MEQIDSNQIMTHDQFRALLLSDTRIDMRSIPQSIEISRSRLELDRLMNTATKQNNLIVRFGVTTSNSSTRKLILTPITIAENMIARLKIPLIQGVDISMQSTSLILAAVPERSRITLNSLFTESELKYFINSPTITAYIKVCGNHTAMMLKTTRTKYNINLILNDAGVDEVVVSYLGNTSYATYLNIDSIVTSDFDIAFYIANESTGYALNLFKLL